MGVAGREDVGSGGARHLKRRHREHRARLARVRIRDHPLYRHLTVSAVEEADRLLLADPEAGEEVRDGGGGGGEVAEEVAVMVAVAVMAIGS